jgi:hypothetical protein
VIFLNAVWRCYAEAWRFSGALLLLFAVAVGVEGLQHVVEWREGLYVSAASAAAHAMDTGRIITGGLKVLWLLVLAFWTARFVVTGSARRTLARDPIAMRQFAWVMALNILLAVPVLYGPLVLPYLGDARRTAQIAWLGFQLAQFPIGVFLIPWGVGAALGDARVTLGVSFQRATNSFWFGLAVLFFAPLPLLALHYLLGYAAMGKPPGLAIAYLIFDAPVAAFTGVVAGVSQVLVAQRMAERAGEPLRLDPA